MNLAVDERDCVTKCRFPLIPGLYKSPRTHSVYLYNAYNTLSLLSKYEILLFMHKYVHTRVRLPSALFGFLVIVKKFTRIIHGINKIFILILY